MRVRAFGVFAAVVAVGLWTGGCDDLGPGTSDLERSRERWETIRPARYVYAVERRCFCGPGSRGPVRVTVDGSVATRRVYVSSGQPVPSAEADLFPTVDGLFELLQDAYERDAHSVDVTYDPATGVPLDLWIDYRENTVDEELGMGVTESVEALAPN